MANFFYSFMKWEKLKRPVFCLDFLFEILSIFNSNFNPDSRYLDVLVVFLFLHRLINAWISHRNRFEFIVRNHSIIPQANPSVAVTLTSLCRVDTTKKLIAREANGHRHSRNFPNLKKADSFLRLTLRRFLRSDDVWVNNAVEGSEEQFPTSTASKQASCISISTDRVCHCEA